MELYEQYLHSRQRVIDFINKLNKKIKSLPKRNNQTLVEREIYDIAKIQRSIANSMKSDLEYSLRMLEGYLPFESRYFTEKEHASKIRAIQSKASYESVDPDGFVLYPCLREDEQYVNVNLTEVIKQTTTKRQRLFLTMYYVYNVPTVTIAEVMGITQPGVYKTLSLGRDNVYDYFKKHDVELDEICLVAPLDPISLVEGIEEEVKAIINYYTERLLKKIQRRGFKKVFVKINKVSLDIEYFVQCENGHTTKMNHTQGGLVQIPERCFSCVPRPEKYDINRVKKIFAKEKCFLISREYQNIYTPLTYRCSCGAYNKTTLRDFLRGVRCSKCVSHYKRKDGTYQPVIARRKQDRWRKIQANVYIVRLYDNNEDFYKVGITTNHIPTRMCMFPYSYEIIHIYKTNLYDACFLENNLLRYHSKFKYKPQKRFGGDGECFSKIMVK